MNTGRRVFSTALAATLLGAGGLGMAVPAAAAPASSAVMVPSVTVEQPVITINDFEYAVPGPVAAGAVVTVVNNDSETHTVTAVDGSFDVNVPGGDTVTFTAPAAAGSYAFFCEFHSNMEGTLVVEAAAQEPLAAPAPEAPEAQAPQEAEAAPVEGMDQMDAVPEGGADTGVSPSDGNRTGMAAAAASLLLAAAAAGALAMRRRNSGA